MFILPLYPIHLFPERARGQTSGLTPRRDAHAGFLTDRHPHLKSHEVAFTRRRRHRDDLQGKEEEGKEDQKRVVLFFRMKLRKKTTEAEVCYADWQKKRRGRTKKDEIQSMCCLTSRKWSWVSIVQRPGEKRKRKRKEKKCLSKTLTSRK